MGEEEELGEGSFTDLRSPLILVIVRQRAEHTPKAGSAFSFHKYVLFSGQEYYQFKARAHYFTEDDHNMRPKEG